MDLGVRVSDWDFLLVFLLFLFSVFMGWEKSCCQENLARFVVEIRWCFFRVRI